MIPVLGATYNDRFSEGHDPFQTMITVGPWIAGSHQPAVGVAYDGDGPLLAENSRWRASAGTFSPLDGTYIPLAGANYVRGPEGDEYRAGLFLLDYEAFVPLVGANWNGDAAFTNWVFESAFFIGAESDGRLDAGPVGPDGALVPLASLSVKKGPPECYGAGAWVGGQLLSVAEACPGLEGTRGWVRDVLELTTILGDQGGECFP